MLLLRLTSPKRLCLLLFAEVSSDAAFLEPASILLYVETRMERSLIECVRLLIEVSEFKASFYIALVRLKVRWC